MLTEKTNILCILEILKKYSDSDHILSVYDILEKLKLIYDIKADRRTVYRNIDALIELGYDISKYSENKEGYYLRERDFEASELHMLCDAVLTAECISERQGKTLIKKLQGLGSIYQTSCTKNLSLMKTDKKAPNPEVFLNIELLDEAISQQKQVEFDYLTYDLSLTLKPRRKEKYIVSPYTLYYSGGQYYLLSGMDTHEGITHYRLDRMKHLRITDTLSKPISKGFNIYDYASKSLFMFSGETQAFTIRCAKKILNDVVDRFGDQIIITDSDDDTFTTIVKATCGGMRIWAIHYIETCEVLEPEWLVNEVKNAIQTGMKNYNIT
ncbi:MAG TPA: WYL domain-containing transcriptional regulator [Anaerovoracaceae bacterium]|nr:WYL domain-containing transcriptional regulator [Anaerovoracaceae bacterium]